MFELLNQIERFQSLKNITGASKMSSYSVSISFDPHSDEVNIELGGYDIGDWKRHTYIKTTKAQMIEDLTIKVNEAVQIVSKMELDYD
jgi:hypothetical protein